MGSRPLGMRAWLTPKNMLLHICYHTKFGRSRSNRMDVGRGSPFGDAWAPIGTGAWLIPCKCVPPHMRYRIKFDCSRSNRLGVGRSPQNLEALRPRPLGRGLDDPRKIRSSHTRVFTPNFVGSAVGSKNFGDAGPHPIGTADPLETCLSPTCLTVPISVILGQTMQTSAEQKISRVPSFKLTRGHWNRYVSIGYLHVTSY